MNAPTPVAALTLAAAMLGGFDDKFGVPIFRKKKPAKVYGPQVDFRKLWDEFFASVAAPSRWKGVLRHELTGELRQVLDLDDLGVTFGAKAVAGDPWTFGWSKKIRRSYRKAWWWIWEALPAGGDS